MKRWTLKSQLNGSILFILLLSFLGSVWINVVNTQAFLNAQLSSHAQDTATSLGLSLREPIANNEKALTEATINAIFDRGFYQHILLQDPYGKTLYKRENLNQPEQVPEWFIELFKLSAPEKQSMIDTGWTIGGVLKVQSHTGTAYAQLWQSAFDFSYMTLFIFFVALFLGYLVLQQVYKPIQAISLQASAITNRDFVLIEKLPRASELHQFVSAMNKMVSSIQATFQELTDAAEKTRREAYIDAQTGIANRRAFNDSLQALLSESEQQRGYLLLVRLAGLAQYNREHGYSAGDHLIERVVKLLQEEVKSQLEVSLFRISGAELACILSHQGNSRLVTFCESLQKQFQRHLNLESYLSISTAAVPFQSGQPIATVMYQLDTAINAAQQSSTGYSITQLQKNSSVLTSATAFKSVIESIIANPEQSISINTQRTETNTQRLTYGLELFAAFTDNEIRLNTGDVFAMANQFELSAQLDIAIVKKVLNGFLSIHKANQKVLINLTKATFVNEQAMQNIVELLKNSGLAKHIVIGLTESAVLTSADNEITNMLNQTGCQICINRFGSSIESLTYLMKVRPSFVKLDSAFTREIDNKPENQQLVGEFVRLAHGLDIGVVAQCVENEHELTCLQALNVDAMQGYCIEKPQLVIF